MFPGQGAQVVGMGRALAEGYEVARRTFEEADDVLGYALSRICFEGPAERLMETDVCQPALVATSVAAFRVASDAGLRPGLVMGHSLGEYSALVAGGALGLADGVRLVAERGAAMLEAGRTSPGAMAAVIGLSDDDARALAEEAGDVWPANFNCPGQVVVSGTVAGVDRLAALAEGRSVRVMRLAVDGAYHSPLMEPAAARLKPALEAWDPAPAGPALPVHHDRGRRATRAAAGDPPGPGDLARALRRCGGGGPRPRGGALRGARARPRPLRPRAPHPPRRAGGQRGRARRR